MKKFKMQRAYLLFAFILGVFITLQGCSGSEGGGGEWNQPVATLVAITVFPTTASIPVTGTQQFTAFATYSDGLSRDVTAISTWTKGTTGVTFGLVKGLATGATANVVPVVITATFEGVSGTADLTVTAATSTKFEVIPSGVVPSPLVSIPVTGTQHYSAIETFSDGTTQDRTQASTWTSPDLVPVGAPGVATITNSIAGVGGGIATGVHPGTSTITASYGVYTGAAAKKAILTVTTATSTKFEVVRSGVSIPITGTQQYTAIETFSDGTSIDRTTVATWTSPDLVPVGAAGVATITNSANGGLDGLGGKATGVKPGTSTITATYGTYTGATAGKVIMTVTAATSKKFEVTPATASIPVTGIQQYTAVETFSDGSSIDRTSAATWTAPDLLPVSTPVVATITNSVAGVGGGAATGVHTGTSTITATYGTYTGLTAAKAILTVTGSAAPIIPGAVCAVDSGVTIPTATMSDPTSDNQFVTTSTSGVAGSGKLIKVTFSLAMNPLTIDATTFTLAPVGGAVLVPASVTYDAVTKVATLTTAAALLQDTRYEVNITTDVTSSTATGSIPIACPYRWNFKTVVPPATGLAPIDLGLAEPFGIAATAGVTNTGATTINGNVVLDPVAGAECNFVPVDGAGGFGLCAGSPPTLNGTVISPLFPADGGATSSAIKADLLAALLSITPPAGPPAAGSLGGATNIPAGTTLGAATGTAPVIGDNWFFPGVYQSVTSIMVTGDLTLDAQGNPDAVFVFQSSSTIGTAAGAPTPGVHTRILLVNGAKASNVWWQAGTAATLGLYSEFQGNILASGDITMLTGASSCGRLLAGAFTSGAFVFDSNVVSVPGNANAPACK